MQKISFYILTIKREFLDNRAGFMTAFGNLGCTFYCCVNLTERQSRRDHSLE